MGRRPRPHPARTSPAPPLGPRPGRRRPGPQPRPDLGADAGLLEAAAWLHDIGYLPELARTGLHGLDGARYLRDTSTPTRCCAAWSPTTPAPSSRPKNAAWPTSCAASSPRPAAAGRRADLLRHDHQPRRPAGPRAPPPGRDPRPLRLRPPGQPVDPPRHPADPPGRRPRPRPERLTTPG